MDSKWIIKIIETLLQPLEYSGEHRLEQWEKGWDQNFREGSVVPHYFGKYPVIRRDGKFVEPPSDATHEEVIDFEYRSLVGLERDVFEKYLSDVTRVYEFGCGTGHNLKTLRLVNPVADLIGLDWAESAVKSVQGLGFTGEQFDMFRPKNLTLQGSVLTVAALEQLGDKFYDFVEFLLEQKPGICVHLEPIEELMDPKDLLDFLQLKYMKKRHYLTGFLSHLQSLEKQGRVEIVTAERNGVGSLFIEGYSLIVWRPK